MRRCYIVGGLDADPVQHAPCLEAQLQVQAHSRFLHASVNGFFTPVP
jgi:hypothetical protein